MTPHDVHAFTRTVRAAEFAAMAPWLLPLIAGKRVVEIGSGDGTQLALLQAHAAEATGLDIPDGTMMKTPQPGIAYYDGVTLPQVSGSVAVLYSSHTLEHVRAWGPLQAEMRRVLAPDGVAVHVVPTATWRVLSWLTHWPTQHRRLGRLVQGLWGKVRRRLGLPPTPAVAGAGPVETSARSLRDKLLDVLWPCRHSEFGTRFTEVAHLSRTAWVRRLEAAGWRVEAVHPLPYVFTDNCLLGPRLPLPQRRWLAERLGLASSVALVVRPRKVVTG